MDYRHAYGKLHRQHDTVFAGRSVVPHIAAIKKLVRKYRPRTMLDYGCGKGLQYQIDKVHQHWGIMPTLFDIGYKPYSKRPTGVFDSIICTDVMEHIDKKDIGDVLRDIFRFLAPPTEDRIPFTFFSITCRPAKKTFPDGRNLHLTVEGPHWWQEVLRAHKPKGTSLSVVYMGVTNEDH